GEQAGGHLADAPGVEAEAVDDGRTRAGTRRAFDVERVRLEDRLDLALERLGGEGQRVVAGLGRALREDARRGARSLAELRERGSSHAPGYQLLHNSPFGVPSTGDRGAITAGKPGAALALLRIDRLMVRRGPLRRSCRGGCAGRRGWRRDPT